MAASLVLLLLSCSYGNGGLAAQGMPLVQKASCHLRRFCGTINVVRRNLAGAALG